MTPAAAIALTGMTAATLRLTASASNLANARDEGPVGAAGYQRLGVVQSPAPGGGVAATAVTLKPASFLSYDPASQAANAQGLVDAPAIDPIAEVGAQIAAGRAFAFSLKVFQVADQTEKALLDLKS